MARVEESLWLVKNSWFKSRLKTASRKTATNNRSNEKMLWMAKKPGGNFGYEKSFHSFAAGPDSYRDEFMARERILQKAHELFMRYGVRSVSMDDIAA